MSDIPSQISQLSSQLNSGDLETAAKTFDSLKLALIRLPSMPPSTVARNESELSLIAQAYELGALLAVSRKDQNQFENSVSILKTLYYDYEFSTDKQAEIVGLYLTYFLSFNRIVDFHSELEQVPYSGRKHPYIAYPLELEASLSEGNYQSVMKAAGNAPSPVFKWFTERILDTIRHEIALSMQKAYDSMTTSGACGNKIEDNRIYFTKEEKNMSVPSWQLMQQSLDLANELEKIV